MHKVRLLIVIILISLQGIAQENTEVKKDSSKRKIDVVFSVGGGIVRYMGDIQDGSKKVNVNLMGNRPALDLSIGLSLSRSFTINLNGVYGKISGNENTFKQHRNFESEMVLAGVNVEYNFAGAWKKRTPVLSPFITAGAYYGNYFNINTDLRDGNGNEYFYWDDGKIRELEETELNRDLNLAPISRDYEYEKSLVNKPVHSFAASAGFGLDLHISRALSVRLMSRYFFSVSDKIDGHFKDDYEGMSDGFFVNQLSLVINTMAFSKKRGEEETDYKYLFDPTQLALVENEDTDGDGVKDVVDLCAATPSDVTVDANGCPLDSDFDGIPDYRDLQKSSGLDAIVDRNGVTVDYQVLAELWRDTLGVNRISWKKEYITGDPIPNEGFTVNIKTLKTGSERLLNPLIGAIKELRKKVINDSLILFTLGVYDHFDDAELRNQELNQLGEKQSYGILESESSRVAEELHELINNLDPALKNQKYGVRKNLGEIKASKAYNNVTMSYTVGRLERLLDSDVPEFLLVKDFLNGTSPFISDSIVNKSYNEVKSNLEEFPIEAKPEYIAAESKIEEVSAETIEPFAPDTMKVGLATSSLETTTEVVEKAPATRKSSDNQTPEEALMPLLTSNRKNKISLAPVKPIFKEGDLDGDGFITGTEIERTLEEILEGQSMVTVSQFNEMVQYYTYFTGNADPIDFGGTEVVIVDGVLTILKKEGEGFPEESRRILAKKYKEVDFNEDGDLTPDEVQKMINMFMEGDSTYSAERIYELIDLYFD